jgi:hypothetical protein
MVHGVSANAATRWRSGLATITALLLLASPSLAAEDQNQSSSSSTQTSSAPPADFLLGRPRVAVGLRGSWVMASANSDLFDFVTEQLSVDRSDFNSGSFGAELAVNVTPRFDIVGGVDLNNSETPNGTRIPIQQTTIFEQVNLTVTAKFGLLPKGRAVSRLAWIPRTFVPYVGIGGGYTSYSFEQRGDFVDFQDDHIFTDIFRSGGWAPTVHVMGGTDIRVHRHILMSFEGKYSWAHADLDSDFIDFDPIDLGGFRFGAGIHFAF